MTGGAAEGPTWEGADMTCYRWESGWVLSVVREYLLLLKSIRIEIDSPTLYAAVADEIRVDHN